MTRWAIFFIFMFVVGQLIALMVEGGGFAVTRLNGAVDSDDVTVTVDNTNNFLSADIAHPAYIQVGNEIMSYTAKTATQFTGVTRGAADPQTRRATTAAAHADNAKVMTLNVSAMDSFIGYNITTSGAAFGALDAVKLVGGFFVNLPKMLLWDYPWLTGPWVIARYLLFAFSGGFIFGVAMLMLTLAQAIWRV